MSAFLGLPLMTRGRGGAACGQAQSRATGNSGGGRAIASGRGRIGRTRRTIRSVLARAGWRCRGVRRAGECARACAVCRGSPRRGRSVCGSGPRQSRRPAPVPAGLDAPVSAHGGGKRLGRAPDRGRMMPSHRAGRAARVTVASTMLMCAGPGMRPRPDGAVTWARKTLRALGRPRHALPAGRPVAVPRFEVPLPTNLAVAWPARRFRKRTFGAADPQQLRAYPRHS